MTDYKIGVGVGVLILKEGKILLGKRKGSHGSGTWSLPGGHLEFGESFEECCKREVLEETNLKVNNLTKLSFTNDIFEKEGKHYVTLFFITEDFEGDLKLMEPDKCERWDWFDLKELPSPLFKPLENLILEGFNFGDEKKIENDVTLGGII